MDAVVTTSAMSIPNSDTFAWFSDVVKIAAERSTSVSLLGLSNWMLFSLFIFQEQRQPPPFFFPKVITNPALALEKVIIVFLFVASG